MSSEPRPSVHEIDRIVDQLERAFEGDAWHGSSLSEILECIPAERAAERPLPRAHTIWEIVLHMTAWQRTVRQRLEGKPLRQLPDEENWPLVEDTSAEAWAEALGELRREYEALKRVALEWRGRDLSERTEGQRYTVYEMLQGVIQHDLYHAGQIALLDKGAVG